MRRFSLVRDINLRPLRGELEAASKPVLRLLKAKETFPDRDEMDFIVLSEGLTLLEIEKSWIRTNVSY